VLSVSSKPTFAHTSNRACSLATATRKTSGSLRPRLSAAAISLWAAKLSGFLFYRALITHHDARLANVLATPSGTAAFWAISFAWGVAVSLPHTLAAGLPAAAVPRFGSAAVDYIGGGLFLTGLCVESAADLSKWQFKGEPGNNGKFCDVGVWSISQHPNWLGNLVLWTGIWLMNAPALAATTGGSARRGRLRLLAGALSPLFLLALFYGQATDRIGKQHALAAARYAHDPRYSAYVEATPLVIPTFESAGRLLRVRAP